MSDLLGLPFTEPSWHFWVGIGITFITNLILNSDPNFFMHMRWLYIIVPLFFGAIIYFALGLTLAMVV